MDLTTRADREGKHAEYANRYDRSDLKVANLKELNMQIDRGYRVRMQPCMLRAPAAPEPCFCWLSLTETLAVSGRGLSGGACTAGVRRAA